MIYGQESYRIMWPQRLWLHTSPSL